MGSSQNWFGRVSFTLVGIVLAAVLVSCIGAGKGKRESIPVPVEISRATSCAICGMPLKLEKWQAQIIMGDGRPVFFDSFREMFGYLLTMKKHGYSRSQGNGTGVVVIWVKDHGTAEWINGLKASYVLDSRVVGPMGKEAVPFADRDDAGQFQEKNGGRIYIYDEIDREKLKTLTADR